ncbi:MAG: transposase [Solirubrobacterales bacterium]|nr:transposase [Solirubrobacterales bacterium]MBV9166931.1 transposase [Solirubrobacterales bacterium]
MDSMTHPARGIVVGVDAHTDTHDVAVLDDCGRLLGTRVFPANRLGYRELLAWIGRFGPIVALGVESTGSYAAGLVRHLRAEGLEVLEINQPHPHARRRRGKNDPIDAEMAGRHVLAASSIVIAKDTVGLSSRSASCASRATARSRLAALRSTPSAASSSPRPKSSADSCCLARPSAAGRLSAPACGPTKPDCTSRSMPPRPRYGRSRGE